MSSTIAEALGALVAASVFFWFVLPLVRSAILRLVSLVDRSVDE